MEPQIGITAPTIRVRIAHASTIKEGWRLSETTVEWVGPITDPDRESAMRIALQEAFLSGTEETILRRANETRLAE